MKMKNIIGLLVLSLSVGACGGSTKSDEVEKKVVVDQTAAELGMKPEALENFQLAIDELAKERPDNAKALQALETSVRLEPEFAEALYNLGILQMRLGDAASAEAHLRSARDIDPDALEYTVALARSLAVQGKVDEAEPLFLEVVARDPDNLDAKNNLAVLALQRGDQEKSLEYLQEILREDDNNVAALKTMGIAYGQQNNASLAKYMFNKAIKIDAKDPDLHNNLGLVYMKEENVPAAVQAFQKAIEVDPNYLEARLNLGAILLKYLDYERANEQFTEAVRIAPNHCVARLGSGASAFAMAQHEKAVQDYEFFVSECDSKHVSSYERLAKLNESFLKQPAEAIKHYETLLTLVDDADKKTQYNAMINFLKTQTSQEAPKTPAPEAEPES